VDGEFLAHFPQLNGLAHWRLGGRALQSIADEEIVNTENIVF
jgi:hypothetical protein